MTALPIGADVVPHRCAEVVLFRTVAHQLGKSTQMSGADVRARIRSATPLREMAWNAGVLGGPLLGLLYGCGLVMVLLARRAPVVASAFRVLVDLVPSGSARRAATFLLQLAFFLGVAGLTLWVLSTLR